MKKQTDDLVKRAKRHESEAFTELMQLYMTDMYKVAYAILMNDEDAADAIGDMILICWEKMNQLVKIQYFKTWMTRIIINKCYDILRKKSKIIPFESEYVENIQEKSNFDEGIEMKMILDKLDNDLKEIVILYYYNDFKQDEIAKILEMPKGTVKSRLHRAKAEIMKILEKKKGVC